MPLVGPLTGIVFTVTESPSGSLSTPAPVSSVTIDTITEIPTFTGIMDDTGSDANDQITKDRSLIFTGTAELGSTVRLGEFGMGLIDQVIAIAGVWTVDIRSTDLPEGDHLFRVRQIDLAGNTSNPPLDIPVTIDITAPAVPSAPDLLAADDTGSSNTDNITSVATPTFIGAAGSVEPGSTVQLFADGIISGQGTADGSGAWSIQVDSPLSEGDHKVTVRATDAAGNTSDPSAVLTPAFTIDTTPPQILSTTPVQGAVSEGALFEIVLEFSEPLDPDLAADPANYSLVGVINGEIALVVEVDPGNQVVRLRPAAGGQFPDDDYTLIVRGVTSILDPAGNALSGDSTITFEHEQSPGPVQVVGVRLRGNNRVTKRVILTFSEELNRSDAVKRSNYRLLDLGRDSRAKATADDRPITGFRPRYRPGSDGTLPRVILVSRRGFVNNKVFQLTVDGLTGQDGKRLDGNGDGVGGDQYAALIARGTSLIISDPNRDRGRLRLVRGGQMEFVQKLADRAISLHLQGTNSRSRITGRRLVSGNNNADGIVSIQNLTADAGRQFRSGLKDPFQIGPLCQDQIDVLLDASSGTLQRVLFEKQDGCI